MKFYQNHLESTKSCGSLAAKLETEDANLLIFSGVALGKTPINKRFDQNINSCWIIREPPGPAPETMKRQF